MKKYTFRIDGKDSLKKLIKLPTAYYRVKSIGAEYIIDSHMGSVKVSDIRFVNLKKEGDKTALYEGNSALKLQSGESFIIEEEAIIGKDRNDVMHKLDSSRPVGTVMNDVDGNKHLGIGLLISRGKPAGELNCINFYDENDPILQKIKEKTGGLYLTVEEGGDKRTVYLSDEKGDPLSDYSDYQYEYSLDPSEQSMEELKTIDSLINAENTQQKFTLQKGEKLSDDIYEANIALDGKPIATLPKIIYYMYNGQLVIRDYVKGEKIIIPKGFHFLKTAQSDRLTFCNILGNEFFEHKKYAPKYSNTSDEYKFADLNCAKKGYNLEELLSHWPLFLITEDSIESRYPSCNSATVFELRNGEKFKKVAELTSKFSYFNDNGQFMHCDCHDGVESYDPSKVNIGEVYSEFI